MKINVCEGHAGEQYKMHCCACELKQAHAELTRLRAENERMRGIIEKLIYASDSCQGHAGCSHSMQPWKDAREYLSRSEQKPETCVWTADKGHTGLRSQCGCICWEHDPLENDVVCPGCGKKVEVKR